MACLIAGEKSFDINCIVFDKDGTLIDFEHAWGPRTVQLIHSLVAAVNGDDELADAFFRTIGYDGHNHQVAPNGPILAASEEKVTTLAAGVLYAQGHLSWHDAEQLAKEMVMAIFGHPLTADEIKPLGDVAGTIRRLCAAGVTIAVATADNRDISEYCLRLLGIWQDITAMICGDDPLPQKPDSGVLAWIADQVGTVPGKMVMVGDTVTDMLAGVNGGAAGCIGISPNQSEDSSVLQPFADVVLATVEDLQIK